MWIHFSPVETLSVKVSPFLVNTTTNQGKNKPVVSLAQWVFFCWVWRQAPRKTLKWSFIQNRHLRKQERQITTKAHRETQLLHHKRKMPLCATEADFISPLWRRAQLSLTPLHWEDGRQSSRALLHGWDLLKTALTGGVSSPFPSPSVISSYTLHTLC